MVQELYFDFSNLQRRLGSAGVSPATMDFDVKGLEGADSVVPKRALE